MMGGGGGDTGDGGAGCTTHWSAVYSGAAVLGQFCTVTSLSQSQSVVQDTARTGDIISLSV